MCGFELIVSPALVCCIITCLCIDERFLHFAHITLDPHLRSYAFDHVVASFQHKFFVRIVSTPKNESWISAKNRLLEITVMCRTGTIRTFDRQSSHFVATKQIIISNVLVTLSLYSCALCVFFCLSRNHLLLYFSCNQSYVRHCCYIQMLNWWWYFGSFVHSKSKTRSR